MKRTLCSFRAWLFILCALSFTAVSAQKNAQQLEEARKQILNDPKIASVSFSAERQTPSLLVINSGTGGYQHSEAPQVLARILGARSGVDYLIAGNSIRALNNIEITEYKQYYKGVRVDRASFKVLSKNGKIVFSNGAWYDVPAGLPTSASITEAQALTEAKRKVGAQKYAWEQVQELMQRAANPQHRQALQQELNEYLPKGELVIIKDFTVKGIAQVRLAYKFNIYAAQPLSRSWIYVDALNGKILLVDKIIKHLDDPKKDNRTTASVDATVQTRYAGTQVIKTKQISGNDPNSGLLLTSSHPTNEIYVPGTNTYVLIDDTRGNGIETYDLNGIGGLPLNVGAIFTLGKSFTDVDNNWTLAQHKRSPGVDGVQEAENDDIAWDAHWGAEVVYDYWLAKHNRLSFDGNNAKIKSYIHYGPAYDNAFWNGTAMTYGDGSGSAAGGFKALTSLDVCGHEIGHAVCTSTSDLVYESEAGAMNEGLSDIWAACIEYYAMTRAGSTVPSTAYRPFYIGEQIGATYDEPLRRMDNPKQQGNPDTYGGANWENPVCTPTLVNDYCGVHTNSGVLNKWFFLMTAGSLTGTRPAGMTPAQYYFADSDDGINDQGETYVVNGLGFDVAEDIAFLMEAMLTSTATYAEARDVSIQVATVLSGDKCSAMVQSVTNAWYAVGVGEAFTSPCVTVFGFIHQPSFTTSEQSVSADCEKGLTFNVPVLIPANTTATVTLSGTATAGKDYTIASLSYTNSTASNRTDNIPVLIYDDAVVENTESIILTISIPGQANVNTSYTINVVDNDVIPVIGSDSVQLLTHAFADDNTSTPFNMPAGWAELAEVPENTTDPTASTGLNHWGLIDGKLGITGKLITGVNLPNGTYNPLAASSTIARTSGKIDARGLSNLRIKFDFTVQGEIDVASPPGDLNPDNFPKFDYMAIVYSFDGVNWTELTQAPYRQFASLLPASGVYSETLPNALNNTQFYLGFRWYNDANAGGPVSVTIDNLSLKGVPRKIENQLSHNAQEKVNVNGDVYFYSTQDGEIISSVNSSNSFDFGCTTSGIENAGDGTVLLYAGNVIAQKVIRITGANTSASNSDYTVTLYYTKQQLDNLAAATGVPVSAFKMFRMDGSSYTDLGTGNDNVTKVALTYTALPNDQGGVFTASFNGSASAGSVTASYAIGAELPQAPLPVNCLDFKAVRGNNTVLLTWKVSDEVNNKQFDVERSTDGRNFNTVGSVNAVANGSGQYSFNDATVSGLRAGYYRLKQVDVDGSYRYLCTILFVSFDRDAFTIGNIYPNPGKGNAIVNISSLQPRKLRVEYVNVSGQLVNWHNETVQAGATRVELKVASLITGSYMIRFKDEDGNVLNTQQYIRQ